MYRPGHLAIKGTEISLFTIMYVHMYVNSPELA